MNGATCTDGVNAYSCSCVAGYTGDRCETGMSAPAHDDMSFKGGCPNHNAGKIFVLEDSVCFCNTMLMSSCLHLSLLVEMIHNFPLVLPI